jgi:putative alpha-1,2-mannosidase
MSARGRWFFFGTGKRPFGMVNVFPDTKNAGQAGGGYNYRFNEVLGFCHLHGWMTVGLDVMPTTNGAYELNKGGNRPSAGRQKWFTPVITSYILTSIICRLS